MDASLDSFLVYLSEHAQDGVIQVADRAANISEDLERPSRILKSFKPFLPISYANRLAYRAAPIWEKVFAEDCHDPTSFFLENHIHRSSQVYDLDLIISMNKFRATLKAERTCWLTLLDFAAEVPRAKWSPNVERGVKFLEVLWDIYMSKKEKLWVPGKFKSPSIDCQNMMTLLIGFRLVFMKGRLNKQTCAEMRAAEMQLQKDLGVLDDWDVDEVAEKMMAWLEVHVADLRAKYDEAVQLEWIGSKPPLSHLTTEATNLDVQCSICQDGVSKPGVLTPCGHTFCAECLQTWCFAALPQSHTCPACRHELFTKPDYRAVETDQDRIVRAEIEKFEDFVWRVDVAMKSLVWLHEEYSWQEKCEDAMSLFAGTQLPLPDLGSLSISP